MSEFDDIYASFIEEARAALINLKNNGGLAEKPFTKLVKRKIGFASL